MPEVDGAQEIERARKAFQHAIEWAECYDDAHTPEDCDCDDQAYASLRTAILKHDPVVVALRDSLERTYRLLASANDGAFENGVTDTTGAIDEGEVRASQIYFDAERTLNATREAIGGGQG